MVQQTFQKPATSQAVLIEDLTLKREDLFIVEKDVEVRSLTRGDSYDSIYNPT